MEIIILIGLLVFASVLSLFELIDAIYGVRL